MASARLSPWTLLAAGWAALSLSRARRLLHTDGLTARIAPPPRLLGIDATRGVMAVLRRTRPTCLERAVVLQAWLAAHGTAVDVVIGVAREGRDLTAHAWLEDGTGPADEPYREIHRLPPPHRADGRSRRRRIRQPPRPVSASTTRTAGGSSPPNAGSQVG